MIVGMALICCTQTTLAQEDPPPLSCRDAIEELERKTPDAFNLAFLSRVVHSEIRDLDAARVGDDKVPATENWTDDTFAGEGFAVLLSCRSHPSDTIVRRADAVFGEYIARHGL